MDSELEASLKEQITAELDNLKSSKPDAKQVEPHTDYSDEAVDQASADTDPFLDEAVKSGYDPNYKGPNKKSAEQFVKDGSFFKKIESQNKKIDELIGLVKENDTRAAKLEKAAYDKAMADITAARDRAIVAGDLPKVRALEAEKAAKAKDAAPIIAKTENEAPKLTQDLLDFQERNKDWFNHQTPENRKMVAAADFIDKYIGKEAHEKGITLSQKEHLELVEKEMKERFPAHFETKQPKPQIRSSGSSSESSGSKLADRLTKQQKEFVTKARTYGSKLTNEEYARQLKLTGDLSDE